MDSVRPAADVTIDLALARALLEQQLPRYAGYTLDRVDEGWDNVTFRVGSDYALRLPRRQIAVELLLKEQRWLPMVASRLSVAVPVPLAAGVPSELFPYPWSLVAWVPGTTADLAPLGSAQAEAVADVLRSLHVGAPADAPTNPVRGVPLAHRRLVVEKRLARPGAPDLAAVWRAALAAPRADESAWLHGDLHPRNAIVTDGRLSGLIDWGDMAAGDVATDLACAWMLFDSPGARAAFLEAYGPSEAERVRAAGWAVNFASALIASGDAVHERLGWQIAARLTDDEAAQP
jgi:aminoglycoside phosphotransferase (APT) family kinase protein